MIALSANTLSVAGAEAWFGLLVGIWVKGAVLVGLIGLLTIALRRASAARRHVVWLGGLAGLALLPLSSMILPTWQAPLKLPPAPAEAMNAPPTSPGLARRTQTVSATGGLDDSAIALASPRMPEPTPRADRRPGHATASVGQSRKAAVWPWRAWCVAIYAAGVAFLALLNAVRVVRLRRMERATPELTDASWQALATDGCRRVGLRRTIRLRIGDEALAPATWGIRRPTVILPPSAKSWPNPQRRSVMLHELAHVKRGDWATQWIATIACAIHWVNPLAWWASRRLRIERELACDDVVLHSGMTPFEYAEHLLALVRSRRRCRLDWPGSPVAARSSYLEHRLRALVDTERNRNMPRPRMIALLMTGILVVSTALATGRPARDEPASTPPLDTTRMHEMRDVLAKCIEHVDVQGRWPRSLDLLFGDSPLQTHPHDVVDVSRFVYRWPGMSKAWSINPANVIVIHESFATWPDAGVAAGFADGHVERFARMSAFKHRLARSDAALSAPRQDASISPETALDTSRAAKQQPNRFAKRHREYRIRVNEARFRAAAARRDVAALALKRIQGQVAAGAANELELLEARLPFMEAEAKLTAARVQLARATGADKAAYRVQLCEARLRVAVAHAEVANHRLARVEQLRERALTSELDILEARALEAEADARLIEAKIALDIAVDEQETAAKRR